MSSATAASSHIIVRKKHPSTINEGILDELGAKRNRSTMSDDMSNKVPIYSGAFRSSANFQFILELFIPSRSLQRDRSNTNDKQ
uniref:Uncharacterized protein n=1 Tax=Romanomermis culicivorax TaxID=13658 RepID=A0A915JY75_ROMCU